MKTYKKKSYGNRKHKKKKKSIHKKKRSTSNGIRGKTLKRKRYLSRKKKGGNKLDMSNKSVTHLATQPDSTLSMPRDIALASHSWKAEHQVNES